MDEPLANIDVTKMTQMLKIQKDMYSPTVLVLGAKCGALLRSQALYHQLSNARPMDLPVHTEEDQAQYCMHLLLNGPLSNREIRSLLFKSLPDTFTQEIDAYVAALLKRNFFQLVLTTSIDVGLEDALLQIGLREKRDFEVFMPGRHISIQSQTSSFTLVKMYGDVTMQQYSLRQQARSLGESANLLEVFEEVKQWNMLMIGFDPIWDKGIFPLLFPRTGNIWYVNTTSLSKRSTHFWQLQESHAQYLLGQEGQERRFFMRLYQRLISSNSLSPQIAEALDKSREKKLLPRSSRSSSRVVSVAIQRRVDVLLLTMTSIEFRALREQWQNDHPREPIDQGETSHVLVTIGDTRVCLMQIPNHPNSQEQSWVDLHQTIYSLAPAVMIVVGAAQGIKYRGQSIGDLLVSQRLWSYEAQKTHTHTDFEELSEEIHQQLYHIPVSSKLLSLFQCGNIALIRKSGNQTPRKFGLMFSSRTEIHEQVVCRLIHKEVADIVALDMAGLPLHSLLQTVTVDCLFIKGIAGWVGERTKEEQAKQAARNAARFTLQVIGMGGFDTYETETSE